MLGALVEHKAKVLVKIFGDALDARNAPATLETHEVEDANDEQPNEESDEEDDEESDEEDEESDEEDEDSDEEDDDSDSVYDDGRPQAPRCDWKAIRAIIPPRCFHHSCGHYSFQQGMGHSHSCSRHRIPLDPRRRIYARAGGTARWTCP